MESAIYEQVEGRRWAGGWAKLPTRDEWRQTGRMIGDRSRGMRGVVAARLPAGDGWMMAGCAGLGFGASIAMMALLPDWWAAGGISLGLVALFGVGWRASLNDDEKPAPSVEPAVPVSWDEPERAPGPPLDDAESLSRSAEESPVETVDSSSEPALRAPPREDLEPPSTSEPRAAGDDLEPSSDPAGDSTFDESATRSAPAPEAQRDETEPSLEVALRAALEHGGSLYAPVEKRIMKARSDRVSSRVVIELETWDRERRPLEVAGRWELEWPEAPGAKALAEETKPWLESGTFNLTARVELSVAGYRFEVVGEPDYKSPVFDGLIEFERIPEGSFQRGEYEVRLSAFVMGRTQVTQAQYAMVMGTNPSEFRGSNRPVKSVRWRDAVDFCVRLAELAGRQPAYRASGDDVHPIWEADGPRLPTEAEWEYACRAGSTTAYSFGDSEEMLGDYAWYADNSGSETHDVAGLRANEWKLHDMHGNVWEWVWDRYATEYPPGPQVNPRGPTRPDKYTGRVLRGGAFWSSAGWVRSASRFWGRVPNLNRGFGFRCAGGPRRQHWSIVN